MLPEVKIITFKFFDKSVRYVCEMTEDALNKSDVSYLQHGVLDKFTGNFYFMKDASHFELLLDVLSEFYYDYFVSFIRPTSSESTKTAEEIDKFVEHNFVFIGSKYKANEVISSELKCIMGAFNA